MEEKIKINTTIERLRQLFPVPVKNDCVPAKEDGKTVDFDKLKWEENFDFAFNRAYADATNRITKRKSDIDDKKYHEYKQALCNELKNLYKKYFSNKSYSFDDMFNECCGVVGNVFEKLYTNDIKFGIKQKFINMLFKYLYCYGDVDRDKFKNCYVPIDRYILSWYKRKEHIGRPHGVENDTWSKMEEDKFRKIQTALARYVGEHYHTLCGGEVTPLQMEFYIWQEEQLSQAEDIIRKLADDKVIQYLPVYDTDRQRQLTEAVSDRGKALISDGGNGNK